MKSKKKLLVSFSGGETSAYMAQWLWRHKSDEFEMIFVFANTGQENEETLQFIDQCEKAFAIKVVWIEAVTNPKHGIGQSFKLVSYQTASRDGGPYEAMISKHGIPNVTSPFCTRELKERPIEKYAKSIGWEDYYTAIGIRKDELDRMSSKFRERQFIYPLVSMRPMSKPMINFWWSQQDFRLYLKGWQGNCKWCWKKFEEKLYMIANETPEAFEFPRKMEKLYENYVPQSRIESQRKKGKEVETPIRFFRGKRTVDDIMSAAKTNRKPVRDDSKDYNYQTSLMDTESCELYSDCGSDSG